MSKMSLENAREIIEYNKNSIYHLPKMYEGINYYLKEDLNLRKTLLKLYSYIKDKELIIQNHRYSFFIPTTKITYRVRKKNSGNSISSRQINLLCAMGLINKQYQSKNGELIDINKSFVLNNPDLRPMNVFYFRRYTETELKRIDERSCSLMAAGVKQSNMSFNMLAVHGLEEIAYEVYPNNNRSSSDRKLYEFGVLREFIDTAIENYGYCTREFIKDNLALDEIELERLLRIFRDDIKQVYNYKRPTKTEMQQWQLIDKKFIYTRR